MRPENRGVTIAVSILFALLANAVAAAEWWPIYGSVQFIIAVGVAILCGATIATLGALLRWPSWVVLLGAAALFLVVGVQLAIPDEATAAGWLPTLGGLLDLVRGLGLGWRQLLTITLPVGYYHGLLVAVTGLVFASTVLSVSLALRIRLAELGAVPPLFVFVLGILFGSSVAQSPVALGVALLAVSLLWVTWRQTQRRRARIRSLTHETGDERRVAFASVGMRTALGAVAILAIAGCASTLTVQALPVARQREVLRDALAKPFDPADYPSPLAALRNYLQPSEASATQLTVRGLASGDTIRVATLDSYDGIVFAVGSSTDSASSGSFSLVPTSVDQSSVSGSTRQVTVTIGAYRGVWLPTVGNLETIRFLGDGAASLRERFYFNRTSSTAALLGGVAQGEQYSMTSIVPAKLSDAALAKVTPGSARVPAASGVPDAVNTRLSLYSATAQGAGAKLVAALAGLRSDGYISDGLSGQAPSRSGHAADRITELLTGPQMIGDAEQYSVTAALMARQLGFASRVVFGFAPQSGQAAVTGKDVSAWIEVDTAQYGWVPINPVPAVRPIPENPVHNQTEVSRPYTQVQPPDDGAADQTHVTAPTTGKSPTTTPNALLDIILGVARVVGIIALILLVLASPLLLIVAAKARRRWLRRRAKDPIDRISGAWDEFRDTAVDHGYSEPSAATRTEFAEVVGLEQSRTLAAVADRAVFSPEAPGAREADRIWVAASELNASLGRGISRWRRFRARISLKSLGGYSVRKLLVRKEAVA